MADAAHRRAAAIGVRIAQLVEILGRGMRDGVIVDIADIADIAALGLAGRMQRVRTWHGVGVCNRHTEQRQHKGSDQRRAHAANDGRQYIHKPEAPLI